MRTALTKLAGIALCCVVAPALAGCSSEEISLSLEVSASPNPVAGVAGQDGRRWDFRITIANPGAEPVVVEFYHAEVTGTDTGYEQPLQPVTDSAVVGRRIEPGGSTAYDANRSSGGKFSRGRERRLYHARGDDGRYFSGEVVIDLQ